MIQLADAVLPDTRRRHHRLESALQERNINRIEFAPGLPYDGLIEPIGNTFRDGFIMRVKKQASAARIRFTIAHEVCHTFFYELVPEMKFVPHETDDGEERLCNIGAAALLLPSVSVRRRIRNLHPCLDTLDEVATEYGVSIATLALRLQTLDLWQCELSVWHRMKDGRFALDRFYGYRRFQYEWYDNSLLESAWSSHKSLLGSSFLHYEDRLGIRRFRPIHYEIRRFANGIIALWGKGIGMSQPKKSHPRTPSETVVSQRTLGFGCALL